MTTALDSWRRHRVDYRIPGLLATLLVAIMFSLLPRLWILWGRVQRPVPSSQSIASPLFSEDEGLQILDVQVLGPTPNTKASIAAQRAVEEPPSSKQEESSPENRNPSSEMSEFAWDPTHAYRLGKELLAPPGGVEPDRSHVLRQRLEFLLSIDGMATLSLTDTSQTALARKSFVVLQRQLFRRNAPGWAYEKAVERYRKALAQMAMDNPLRGPQ